MDADVNSFFAANKGKKIQNIDKVVQIVEINILNLY